MRRFQKFCLALIITIGIGLSGFTVVKADEEIVKVGVIDYPNYLMMHQDGTVTGYAMEYLEEIQKYTNWKYEFVEMSLNDAYKALAERTIDILPGNQYTASRAALYDYSTLSMGDDSTVLCVMPENKKYSYNDFENYGGMNIGALKGTIRVNQTIAYLATYGVEVNITLFDTDLQTKEALEAGSIDAVLMGSIRCESNYRILARMNNTSLYFCTNKKRPELKEELDDAMTKIHLEEPYYEAKLEGKYYGDILRQFSLTTEEQNYIDTSGAINVSVSNDLAPIEYYDSGSKSYVGISISLLEKISESTGLTFNLVERGDTEELREDLNNGSIMVVGTVMKEMASQLFPGLTSVGSTLTNSFTVISKNTNDLTTESKVIMIDSYPYIQTLAERSGYANIEFTTSFTKCLDAVNKGKADLTILPNYRSEILLKHQYYQNLESYEIPDSQITYSFGVNTGAKNGELLYSIFNKALQNISSSELKQIQIQNSIKISYEPDYLDYWYLYWYWIVIAVGLIGLGVLAAVLHSQKQLARANQATVEAAKAKNQFFAQISHDLRTPLNGILGLSELDLQREDVKGTLRDDLGSIHHSGEYLLRLVNDLLELASLENKKLVLDPKAINGPEFIKNVQNLIQPIATEKKVTLVTNFDMAPVPNVMLDSLRMEQVYMNLLSNAIKFSPPGSKVEWTIVDEKISDSQIMSTCTIKDHGCGISKEFMPKMFEPFEIESANNNSENTGLGLAIVKQLVDVMKGTIEVESELNKGTTFIVKIPISTKIETDKASLQETKRFEGKRILVADDQPLNLEVAARILRKVGFKVDTANDGNQLVKMFQKSPVNYYAACLIDLRMPELDGYKAAEAIRELKREDSKTIPLIAMSANISPQDQLKAKEAGMNAHLGKPIETKLMIETLNRLIK